MIFDGAIAYAAHLYLKTNPPKKKRVVPRKKRKAAQKAARKAAQ